MTKKEPSWNDAPKRLREARWGYHKLKQLISGRKNEGYKILSMKDIEKEWDFIIESVDKYLAKKDIEVDPFLSPDNYKDWVKYNLSKVAVHFYHHPRDTEEPFILGNTKLIQRGFKILWVYNPEETSNTFVPDLKECMGEDNLKHCAYLEMDEVLKIIPINFTVIAPYHKALPLVYVRFEDLDCAIRIESRGPTVLLFDALGCRCIIKAHPQDSTKDSWIPPLLEG